MIDLVKVELEIDGEIAETVTTTGNLATNVADEFMGVATIEHAGSDFAVYIAGDLYYDSEDGGSLTGL